MHVANSTIEIAEIVSSASDEVFSTMLNLRLDRGKVSVDRTNPPNFDGVLVLVGIAGTWLGLGRIAMSPRFACEIASGLLLTPCEVVNEEVLDAVAEIGNMIIGSVKVSLEEHLGALNLSVPTVLYGINYQARSMGATEWTVVPFKCGDEALEVRFCLMPATVAIRGRHEVLHV